MIACSDMSNVSSRLTVFIQRQPSNIHRYFVSNEEVQQVDAKAVIIIYQYTFKLITVQQSILFRYLIICP